MSMLGSCRCNNISLSWKNRDYSLVPRSCLCDYCAAKGAAYVSKSGTSMEVVIRKEEFHTVTEHGSRQAQFHECGYCGELVLVTASIEGSVYCVINVHCLDDRRRFCDAISVDFSGQSAQVKLDRWRQNWCHLVSITSAGFDRR
jgi:hypothetical protein